MEGLIKRTIGLAVVLMAAGAWIQFTPRVSGPGKSEAWLKEKAPATIGSYRLDEEYQMDPATYKELKPYGIVARKYSNGDKNYDVVIVAGNKKESFHDPRVCFTSQGWDIASQREVIVATNQGPLPMTIARMNHPNAGQRFAAFLYKGPGGFYASPQKLSMQWLLAQLQGETGTEAVFYRFIPDFENATEADLQAFVVKFLVAAKQSSDGFF